MTEINIGDKVRFLNDIGGGTVSGFQKGGIVLVEDEDGFEIPMRQEEVVVVNDDKQKKTVAAPVAAPVVTPQPKPQNIIKPVVQPKPVVVEDEEEETLEARVLRLEMTIKKLQRRIERLEDAKALREKIKAEDIRQREEKRLQMDDVIEIDLHASELLDTTAGMSAGDIKDYQMQTFRKVMDEHLKDKGRKIIFIHGNGEGVLRKAIMDELRRSYKKCEWQDASFQQYGFGATMVIIH